MNAAVRITMTICVFLLASLWAATAPAVVITCVNEGNDVARIDYSASDENALPIAFALDVTLDAGAVIGRIYDYKLGDSNAASPGFGIFPASLQFAENGEIIGWGTPVVSGGPGSSAVTLAMASRYAGRQNAPLVKGTLCRMLVDTRGAPIVNVKVAQNAPAGGVVLETAVPAKFRAVGCTVGTSSPPPDPNTDPNAPPGAFQQDSGPDGILSIEAENYTYNISRRGRSWNLITSPEGYSGSDAMRAEPDSGANFNVTYPANSPRLDFSVNFVKTGKHYIWIRAYATGKTDRSCHAGLDGKPIKTCDRIDRLPAYNQWVWTSRTMDDNSRATFKVAGTGLHTFNIWMRQDGFRIDKIVITTNPRYTPTGTGPVQSPGGE